MMPMMRPFNSLTTIHLLLLIFNLSDTNAFSRSPLTRLHALLFNTRKNQISLQGYVYGVPRRFTPGPSSALKGNMKMGSSKGDNNDNTPKEESQGSCPYSMTFPMYRIPISGGKDKKSNNNSNGGIFSGLFSGIVSSAKKSEFERKYESNIINDNKSASTSLLWYDAKETISSDEHKHDDERVKQGKMGVHVSAFVWRSLSNIVNDTVQQQLASKTIIIGIENTSMIGLKQLADIINWMKDADVKKYYQRGDGNSNIAILARVDEESPIPTIILEAKLEKNYNINVAPISITSEIGQNLNEETVTESTKKWVKRILVDMKICPFTKSTTKSGQGLGDVGVPVGGIAYHYSEAMQYQFPKLMADTWEAISDMVTAGPSGRDGISSILLAAPEFDNDFSLWAGPVFAMLEANVSAAKAEQIIGIVCFHPYYKTPDGQSWPGFGHMHSVPRLCKWVEENDKELFDQVEKEDISAGGAFQRRTPHATINVLRAEQLEAAEGRRSTGNLYSVNIRRLYEEGFQKLEHDLNQERMLKK